MKKILSIILLSLVTLGASAQEKGHFEIYDFDTFKLHVYYTNDALNDASYIIEGKNSLVTMEQPLFKENVTEYNTYLTKLNKTVVKRITDYHLGGTEAHEIVMPEGMLSFTKGEIYDGMMKGFSKAFGDLLTAMPTGKVDEVAFDSTHLWAGVPFEFYHGASSDFPGASILIGKKVYYTHWAPAKAHMSHLQLSSRIAIDAEIIESEKAMKSGATLFIGGHGGATKRDALQFKITYLKSLKDLLANNKSPESFITAMKKAYPQLLGEDGLEQLAQVMYK